jgi:cell wall-associated NlpC family hydrolase
MAGFPFAPPPVRAAGLLLVVGLLAAGCASSGSTSVEQPTPTQTRTATEVDSTLRSAADEWLGVSQEWGGTSKEGVDCSGLVLSIYASEFSLSLPRTTDQQVRTGTEVSRSALRPGDLVFFRHNRKDYHVGIYLSDGEFLHTSSNEGVTITALDRPYWDERWWQGRRLLDLSSDSARAASNSGQTDDASSGIGW